MSSKLPSILLERFEECSDSPSPSFLLRVLPHDSQLSAFLTTFASTVGSGVLALPYVFAGIGWPAGIATLVLGCMVNVFTCYLLLDLSEEFTYTSLDELFKELFCASPPTRWQAFSLRLTELSIIINNYGAAVAYFIVVLRIQIATVFQRALRMCSFTEDGNSVVLWAFVVAILVFPLCLYEAISMLRYTSVVSVVSGVYLAGFLIWEYSVNGRNGHEKTPLSWSWNHQLSSISLVLFAFTCQSTIAEIYKGMRKPHRTLSGLLMLVITFSSVVLLYILIGLFGYLRFPKAKGNILLEGHLQDKGSIIAMFLSALALFANIPLLIYPFRKVLYHAVWGISLATGGSTHRIAAVAVPLLVAASLAAGLATVTTDYLTLVMGVVGAVSGAYICVALPCALYLKAKKGNSYSKLACKVLVAAAAPIYAVSLAGLFAT